MEDTWQGFQDCTNSTAFMETYKWYLSRVVDTNRNVITYNYDRMSENKTASCRGVSGVVDYAIRPTSITWGANSQTGSTARYEVVFNSSSRPIETCTDKSCLDYASNQMGQPPQEKWQLDFIDVNTCNRVPGSWFASISSPMPVRIIATRTFTLTLQLTKTETSPRIPGIPN